MIEDKATQHWAELEQLENKAHGSFTGGLLLSVDPNALLFEEQLFPTSDPEVVNTILDLLQVLTSL